MLEHDIKIVSQEQGDLIIYLSVEYYRSKSGFWAFKYNNVWLYDFFKDDNRSILLEKEYKNYYRRKKLDRLL